ncbi:hypothetical protein EVAR_92583_1 [Eumeta japonica]|uniref:Uncharacterized protein n=1 Tax=Eumeta variegata TaxID=151549 RepID=A0A4C1SXE3_EUMVA|nr:hypothetical protein EVAR_92583_1 [Eumeta japonica]
MDKSLTNYLTVDAPSIAYYSTLHSAWPDTHLAGFFKVETVAPYGISTSKHTNGRPPFVVSYGCYLSELQGSRPAGVMYIFADRLIHIPVEAFRAAFPRAVKVQWSTRTPRRVRPPPAARRGIAHHFADLSNIASNNSATSYPKRLKVVSVVCARQEGRRPISRLDLQCAVRARARARVALKKNDIKQLPQNYFRIRLKQEETIFVEQKMYPGGDLLRTLLTAPPAG